MPTSSPLPHLKPPPPVAVGGDLQHPLLHGHAHHGVAAALAQTVNHLLIGQHCRREQSTSCTSFKCPSTAGAAGPRWRALCMHLATGPGLPAPMRVALLLAVNRLPQCVAASQLSFEHQVRMPHLCQGQGTS